MTVMPANATGGFGMNKRLMEFLHELTEENDRLQMRSNAASHDNVMLRQENERQKQEIKELKAKLRQIKKTRN